MNTWKNAVDYKSKKVHVSGQFHSNVTVVIAYLRVTSKT